MEEENKNEEVVDKKDLDIDDLEENDLEESSETDNEATKKQTREENRKYAELRRQHEAEQKKNKELEERNRILEDQVKYSTQSNLSDDDLEELGIDKVETEDELFLAQEYLKAKSKGEINAAVIAYKSLRNKDNKAKEEESKKAKEAEENDLINKDVELCVKNYKMTPTKILENKGFMDLFGEAIHNGNVGYLYGKYLKIVAAEEKANEVTKQNSIPPLPNGKNGNPTKKYSEMSKSEKVAYLREQHLIN